MSNQDLMEKLENEGVDELRCRAGKHVYLRASDTVYAAADRRAERTGLRVGVAIWGALMALMILADGWEHVLDYAIWAALGAVIIAAPAGVLAHNIRLGSIERELNARGYSLHSERAPDSGLRGTEIEDIAETLGAEIGEGEGGRMHIRMPGYDDAEGEK